MEDGEVGGQELLSLINISDSNEDNQAQWPNSVHGTAFKVHIGKELAQVERELGRQVKLQVCNIARLFAPIVDKLTNVEGIDRTVG